jgi:hypothetical protein
MKLTIKVSISIHILILKGKISKMRKKEKKLCYIAIQFIGT